MRIAGRQTGIAALAVCIAFGGVCGCNRRTTETIAVIPQTEGSLRWEAAHVGAEEAVQNKPAFIYWNAPMREDDVEAQIAVVDRVASGNYQGLVLAPDQALALMTPVRRAVARGMPTVVIGSPLGMPPDGNLFYILNDNETGGRMAAQRAGEILHGSGTIAILGIDPDLIGIMDRTRVFESVLAQQYPQVLVVEKRLGSLNVPHEQQVAEETVNSHPDLDMIVAMTGPSLGGTLTAVSAVAAARHIRIIGFDVDGWPPPFTDNPGLDCIIQEDTRTMGRDAVSLILRRLAGQPVEAQKLISPVMITRDNVGSASMRRMSSQDWTLGRIRWSRIQ
jgi:ribose transport system substrate-binding protein